jgi:hypothetical protein
MTDNIGIGAVARGPKGYEIGVVLGRDTIRSDFQRVPTGQWRIVAGFKGRAWEIREELHIFQWTQLQVRRFEIREKRDATHAAICREGSNWLYTTVVFSGDVIEYRDSENG